MTHANTIQGALPILARAVGRQLHVDVRIGGSTAFTDGKRIQLPALPFDNVEDIEPLAFGYLEHEAAHLRYSELPFTPTSPLHQAITNIFEDIRVEACLTKAYPGFARTLRQLVSILVRDGGMAQPQPAVALPETLVYHLLYRLRSDVLGQVAVSAYATEADTYFRTAVPDDVAARLENVLGRVRDLQTTQQAIALAQEVVDLFTDAVAPPPSGDRSSGEASGGEPELSGPASPSESEGNPSPDEAGAPGDPAGPGKAPPASGSCRQEGSPSGQSAGDAQAADHEASSSTKSEAAPTPTQLQAIRDLLASEPAPDAGTLSKTIADKLNETAAAVSGVGHGVAGADFSPSPLDGSGNPHAVLSSVSAATSALRIRLRSFVEATRRTRRFHRRQGKRLACRRLVRAMTGDPRIYRRKLQGPGVNTAAVILLDRSHSMRSRIVVARRSALACTAALEEISGVSVAGAAFPGYRRPLDLLTGFGERVRHTAQRYEACHASGGTPLLPALLWAAEALLLQPEPRKLLLVVTDGDPDEFGPCASAIQRCWRGGIETLGLGIGLNVSQLFPISRNIADVSELAPAMFQMLQEGLTRRPVS